MIIVIHFLQYLRAPITSKTPECLFFSQNWLRNHILQPQLSIQKSYVVCIYVQYTNILFRYKVLVSPRLAHTRAANIHTTHKGGARFARANNSTDGARASRAPHRYCCFSLCVWCECWRHVCVCVLALGSLTLYTWIICLCIAYIYTQ